MSDHSRHFRACHAGDAEHCGVALDEKRPALPTESEGPPHQMATQTPSSPRQSSLNPRQAILDYRAPLRRNAHRAARMEKQARAGLPVLDLIRAVNVPLEVRKESGQRQAEL